MQIQARRFGEVLAEGISLLTKTWRPLIAPSFGAFMVLGAATMIIFRLTEASELLDLIFNNPGAIELLPTEELAEIRRAVRALCADFPGEYPPPSV